MKECFSRIDIACLKIKNRKKNTLRIIKKFVDFYLQKSWLFIFNGTLTISNCENNIFNPIS